MLSRRQPTFHSHSETLVLPRPSHCASPLLATLTRALQLIENPTTLSPFPAALTSRVKPKSFICHSYKKHGGWVYLPSPRATKILFLRSVLATRHQPLATSLSPNQLLQILFRPAHIFHLLRPGNLPLNRHRTRILHLLQPRDNPRKIHFALSDRHFLPQLLRISRPHSIFRVNPLHVRPKYFDRIHGIRLPIQNQVRQIKIHSLIVQSHILNRTHQSNRRLLPRLIPEILSLLFAMPGNLAHRLHRLFVNRIVRILRNESAMRLHRRHAALLRKLRCPLDMCHPRRPRLSRHQPNRQRPPIKIPHFLPRPAHHNRRRLNPIFLQRRRQLFRQPRRKLLAVRLASRQSQFMHLRQRGIRVIPNPDDQSQPQRLFPLIPKRLLSAICHAELWLKRHKSLEILTAHKRLAPRPQSRRQRQRRTLQKSPAILFARHLHAPISPRTFALAFSGRTHHPQTARRRPSPPVTARSSEFSDPTDHSLMRPETCNASLCAHPQIDRSTFSCCRTHWKAIDKLFGRHRWTPPPMPFLSPWLLDFRKRRSNHSSPHILFARHSQARFAIPGSPPFLRCPPAGTLWKTRTFPRQWLWLSRRNPAASTSPGFH